MEPYQQAVSSCREIFITKIEECRYWVAKTCSSTIMLCCMEITKERREDYCLSTIVKWRSQQRDIVSIQYAAKHTHIGAPTRGWCCHLKAIAGSVEKRDASQTVVVSRLVLYPIYRGIVFVDRSAPKPRQRVVFT